MHGLLFVDTTMLTAMLAGDWEKAYKAGRDSLWYQQTKGRASRVTMIILTGNLVSVRFISFMPLISSKDLGIYSLSVCRISVMLKIVLE